VGSVGFKSLLHSTTVDHPRSGVVIYWFSLSFDSVCLCRSSVMITFESLDVGSSYNISRQAIRAKFVYEGHRVIVKVTGAKRSRTIQYFRNGTDGLRASTNSDYCRLKIQSPITLRL